MVQKIKNYGPKIENWFKKRKLVQKSKIGPKIGSKIEKLVQKSKIGPQIENNSKNRKSFQNKSKIGPKIKKWSKKRKKTKIGSKIENYSHVLEKKQFFKVNEPQMVTFFLSNFFLLKLFNFSAFIKFSKFLICLMNDTAFKNPNSGNNKITSKKTFFKIYTPKNYEKKKTWG